MFRMSKRAKWVLFGESWNSLLECQLRLKPRVLHSVGALYWGSTNVTNLPFHWFFYDENDLQSAPSIYKIYYNAMRFCISFNKCSCFIIAAVVAPSNTHILRCNSTQCPPAATTHCPSPSNLSSLALHLDEWCLPPSKAETTGRMWECGEEGMTLGLQATLMQLPPRVSLLFFCFL